MREAAFKREWKAAPTLDCGFIRDAATAPPDWIYPVAAGCAG